MPDTPITVFNTKTRSKEPFFPLVPGEVSIYHCGPTVYNFQHIGNMRRFIFADLVHRMFSANGLKVNQIINITDVGHLVSDEDEGEDKMEKGAKREGKTAQEIAAFYTADFMDDLNLLHIRTDETRFPKATENIPEQIALIQTLEEKGFTYQTSDGIYFDTSKDPRYGELARLDIEGLKEGARVEANQEKKNITDFALWKFSPADENRQQEWESPWGVGFPGWHIECSAMAQKFLGTTIDLHTGGIDHIPVHHTNEIAQSENANGVAFAHYWMHNEHVNFNDGKISKSGESFIRLKDLIEKGYHPLAYKYFTLVAHYRTKINFTHEGLNAASVAWKKINEFVAKGEASETENAEVAEIVEKALSFFNDDLDTPKIIALVWETIKNGSLSDEEKRTAILKIDEMLGIIDHDYRTEEGLSFDSLPDDIKALVEERQKARAEKDWGKSDEVRATLKEKGYEITDVTSSDPAGSSGSTFSIKKA
jgi:cysteinyl-tRNA synthetase